MADQVTSRIQVVTIAGGAGQPINIITYSGTLPYQTFQGFFPLTGAQNTAITAAFTAVAGTTTVIDIPAQANTLIGTYNS